MGDRGGNPRKNMVERQEDWRDRGMSCMERGASLPDSSDLFSCEGAWLYGRLLSFSHEGASLRGRRRDHTFFLREGITLFS